MPAGCCSWEVLLDWLPGDCWVEDGGPMIGSGSFKSESSTGNASVYSPSSSEDKAGSAIFDVPALLVFSLVR